MALGGGIFTTQNKKLPGAYINFVSAQRANASLSDRGVCAVPMSLNWGPDNQVLTITADDFINRSQKILGYDYGADQCLPFRELFKSAQTVHVYKLNSGTAKAENEYATAKYGGSRGNDIKLVITSNVDSPAKFDVKTLVDNIILDEQKGFTNTSELKSNDFVDFKQGVALKLTAGMPLEGGDNGQGTKASCKYAEAKVAGEVGNEFAINITQGDPLEVTPAKKASCKYAEAKTAGDQGNSLKIQITEGEEYEVTPAKQATCKHATAKQAGAAGNHLKINIAAGTPQQTQAAVSATCKYGTAKTAGVAGNNLKVVITGSTGAWKVVVKNSDADVYTKDAYAPASDTIVPTELENDYITFSAVALTAEEVSLTGGADAVTTATFTVTTLKDAEEVDKQENLLNKDALQDNNYVTFKKTEALTIEEVALSGGADAVMGQTYTVTTLQGSATVDTQENLKNKSELTDNAYVTFTKTAELMVETVPLSGGANAVITPRYNVETKQGGVILETQHNITDSSELADNQWVTFFDSVDLELGEYTLQNGGENITVGSWQNALNVLEGYSFNTLGIVSNDEKVKSLAVEYTKRMRDNVGIKFQTVVFNHDADYAGVINLVNGLETDQSDPSLVYWMTGAQCACRVYASLTNQNYTGELAPDVSRTQTQLESCIDEGQLVLHKVGDDIRVLTDINSKVSITEEEGEDFKSNQTIRVLDQIGNDVASLFNDQFLGKVPNDEAGRTSLWNEIVKHHQELARLRAIENFLPEDVTISIGNDRKSVLVNDVISPVNALERLYMSVVAS